MARKPKIVIINHPLLLVTLEVPGSADAWPPYVNPADVPDLTEAEMLEAEAEILADWRADMEARLEDDDDIPF